MNTKSKDYLKPKSKLKYFVFILIYFSFYPFCKLLYGRKNNWLICERGIDAQDNGYFFYKYLKENHKEINVVYLIDNNSSDYEKVSSLGETVRFGSIKHFLMAIGFPVKISSHLFGYAPWIQMALFFRRNATHDVHVFLQHGITKNYIEGFFYKNCKSLKLFVCGAKPEYDYLSKYFGYPSNVVQYTGFSRYDLLIDSNVSNNILIMPTWRRYLENLSSDKFEKSVFYKNWNQFLTNRSLLNLLKTHNVKIDFYLHNSLQKYSNCFQTNEVVKIIHFKDQDVQSLLKNDRLLVTDYSSVFFDFAYMKKPVIYYQFDESEYYNGHYDKGYFDYRKDGFGEVCVSLNQVINSFIQYLNNNFSMIPRYSNKINNFFELRDASNSKRIFDAILELVRY